MPLDTLITEEEMITRKEANTKKWVEMNPVPKFSVVGQVGVAGRASVPSKLPMNTRTAYMLNKALEAKNSKLQGSLLEPVACTPPKIRRIREPEKVLKKVVGQTQGEVRDLKLGGIGRVECTSDYSLHGQPGQFCREEELRRIMEPEMDSVPLQIIGQTPGKVTEPLLQPNGVYLSPKQIDSQASPKTPIPKRLFDPIQDSPLDLSPRTKEGRVKSSRRTPKITDLGLQVDNNLSSDQHELDHQQNEVSRDITGEELEPPMTANPKEFQPGRVDQVHWLGAVFGCDGKENLITDYYFVSPGYKAICLRATLSVPLQKVWQYVGKQMRHNMQRPIVSYLGAEVDMASPLDQYPPNTTFTIHDGSVPQEFLDHKGKLWQCLNCSNPGYKARKNFNGKSCTNNNPHMFFCHGEVPLSWGNIVPHRNKVTVPWGAPVGLKGIKMKAEPAPVHLPSNEPDPAQGSSRRTRCLVTSRPGSRRSPTSPSPILSSSPHKAGRSIEESRASSPDDSSGYLLDDKRVSKRKPVGDQLLDLMEHSVGKVPIREHIEMRKMDNGLTRDLRTKGKRTKGQRSKGKWAQCTEQLEPMVKVKEQGSSNRTRGKRVDYTKHFYVEEGEDLDSESAEDYEPAGEGYDDSSESEEDESGSEGENEMKTKVGDTSGKKQRQERSWLEAQEDPLLTDDEEEDSEYIRQARHLGKFQMRQEMQERKDKVREVNLAADKYVADERDIQLLSEHLVKPLLVQSQKWQKFKSKTKKKVKDMVLRGELPTGKNPEAWADVVYTPVSYLRGLKDLLGKYQKELLERGRLKDDRLHIWAMMEAYKTKDHIEFPEIIIHLLEQIDTPTKAKFALAGFCQLIDSRIVYICKPEGQAQYFRKTPKEAQMFTTDEEEIDFEEHVREQIEKEKTKLNNLRKTILKGKPYQQFQCSVEAEAKERKEFMKQFQGADTPLLADAVPRYMQCMATKQLYKELTNLASKKAKIKPRKLLELGVGLAKRWHIKQCHRIEWVNKLTFGLWLDLLEGGWNKFPHVVGELNEDEQELVMCMSVEIGKNKVTGRPLVFNLSKTDVIMGRCYEALRKDVLLSLDLDPMNLDTPFFINSKGRPLVHPKAPPFDWTDFSIVAGCGPVTSHVARKMQSQFITVQKDTLLLEAREFMLNHSEAVDKHFYQNTFRQSDLAKYGQAKIRTMLDLEEDRETGDKDMGQQVFVDKEQQDRERKGQIKAKQELFDKFLEQERQIDEKVVSSLQRFVTNRIKLALIEAIIFCTNKAITNKGELCDIFMTGQNVRKKSCTSILIRMIHLVPPEIPCIKVLRESLLKFVELNEVVGDLRLLEWRWSCRLTSCLHKMSVTKSLGSQNLLHTLALFNKEKMNKYCFNNLTIVHLVTKWQASEYVREASQRGDDSMVSVAEFLAAKRDEIITGKEVTAAVVPAVPVPKSIPHLIPQFLPQPDDQEHQFKLWPAHTSSPNFDDNMKLDFLEQFILSAEDPSIRSKKAKGKAAHNYNLTPMMNSVGVIVSGHTGRFLLSTLVASEDTLAQFLQVRGLRKQMKKFVPPKSGLLGLVDMWLETQEDHSNEALRANVKKLIIYAKSL